MRRAPRSPPARCWARRALSPVTAPGKVLCVGLNYREHIEEMGRALPTHPTLFTKFADTLCGPDDEIELLGSDAVDWEAELVVAIGAEVFRADDDEARAAIAGYTVANDISARDWQNRTTQWLSGKAFDGTTPVGPVVVTTTRPSGRECRARAGCAVRPRPR